jgi:hypothetical protein
MLAVVAIAALLEFLRPVNHDVAWILTVADLMHAGRHLYADIIEINPPLIFWAANGMRGLAQLLHLAPEAVYRIFTLALGFGSAVAVRRLTGSPWPALALLSVGLILVGPDFGQRDLLTVFLMAPYVAMASMGSRPRWDWPIGVAAGLGLCLKPHYVGIWAVVFVLNRARRADLAILLTGAAYLGCVVLVSPAFFPLAAALGPAYQKWLQMPWTTQLLSIPAFIAVGIMTCAALARRAHAAPAWAWGFALATGGALLAMLLQAKPFSYHQQPILVFAAITLGGCWHYRLARPAVWMFLLLLGVQSANLWYSARKLQAETDIIAATVQQLPPRPIVLLSQYLFHGPPAFRAIHQPWRLDLPCLWWLGPDSLPLAFAFRHVLLDKVRWGIESAELVVLDPSTRDLAEGATPFANQVLAEPELAGPLAAFERVPWGWPLLVYRRYASP